MFTLNFIKLIKKEKYKINTNKLFRLYKKKLNKKVFFSKINKSFS